MKDINCIPSDVSPYGTITGRTSGLITTLPSVKKPNKLGSSIKHQLHWAPEGCKFVSFDFSALELVIAAAYNSLEECRFEQLESNPMQSKVAKLVFEGQSSKGTDVHTVIAKQLGISRGVTKSIEYGPLGSECLVLEKEKGWVSIKDIQVGDFVDAYDLTENSRCWTEVSHTVAYKQKEALKVKVGKLDFITTSCHRWPAFDSRTKEFKGYKRTDELSSEDVLKTAFVPKAQHFPSEADSLLTPDEARLLGWLITDGNWQTFKAKSSGGRNNKGGSYRGCISQSKPKYISDISKLLKRLNLPSEPILRKSPTKLSKMPSYNFPISGKILRPLFKKITGSNQLVYKKDFSLTNLLPLLSLAALRALLFTMIKAEGNCNKKSVRIAQSVSSPIHNDIERLANLCGYSVKVHTRIPKPNELAKSAYSKFRLHRRKALSWQKVTMTPIKADVYCLTTGTSNFFTKICGQTLLTGNCLYGSGLNGLKAIARPEMEDISEARLTEICKDFMLLFKGEKVRYGQQFSGGLFSYFFNYAYDVISQSEPRLPFLKTGITSALTPRAVGPDYMTSRMNWTVQASGGELHDAVMMGALSRTEPVADPFWATCKRKFYGSVHD